MEIGPLPHILLDNWHCFDKALALHFTVKSQVT